MGTSVSEGWPSGKAAESAAGGGDYRSHPRTQRWLRQPVPSDRARRNMLAVPMRLLRCKKCHGLCERRTHLDVAAPSSCYSKQLLRSHQVEIGRVHRIAPDFVHEVALLGFECLNH